MFDAVVHHFGDPGQCICNFFLADFDKDHFKAIIACHAGQILPDKATTDNSNFEKSALAFPFLLSPKSSRDSLMISLLIVSVFK